MNQGKKFKKFRHLPTLLDPYRFSFFPATIRSWNQLTFGKDEFGSAKTFNKYYNGGKFSGDAAHTYSTV